MIVAGFEVDAEVTVLQGQTEREGLTLESVWLMKQWLVIKIMCHCR